MMLVLLLSIQFWTLCAHLAYHLPPNAPSVHFLEEIEVIHCIVVDFQQAPKFFLGNIQLLHQQHRLTTLWVPAYKHHHINHIEMSYINKVYKQIPSNVQNFLVRISIFLTSTFQQRKRNLESRGYESYTQILWIYFYINQFLFEGHFLKHH